jgi:hypothetical protein
LGGTIAGVAARAGTIVAIASDGTIVACQPKLEHARVTDIGPPLGAWLTADGAHAVFGGADATAIWRTSPLGHVATVQGRPPSRWTSPLHGDRLVVATPSGALRVFDLAGRPQGRLHGHARAPTTARITEAEIATASLDGTVRRFGFDGRSLQVIRGRGAASAVAVTDDRRWLVSGWTDGSLRYDPIDLGAAFARACSVLAGFSVADPYCAARTAKVDTSTSERSPR